MVYMFKTFVSLLSGKALWLQSLISQFSIRILRGDCTDEDSSKTCMRLTTQL